MIVGDVAIPTGPRPSTGGDHGERRDRLHAGATHGGAVSARKYNYGPLFMLPSLQKPTILMPGIAGGASWSGEAFDPKPAPDVPSNTLAHAVTMKNSPVPHADYVGEIAAVETPQGVPLGKPPYSRVTAIDLNTGDHRWMVPMGDLAQSNPVLRQTGLLPLGEPRAATSSSRKRCSIIGKEGTTQREAQRESAPPGTVSVPNFEIHEPKLVTSTKRPARSWGKWRCPATRPARR